MKTKTLHKTLVTVMALFAVSMLIVAPALAAKGGNNATTLAGYKTVDICVVDPTDENPAGSIWRYSGEISVWNEGVLDTVGLNITDFIEYKTDNKWIKAYNMPIALDGVPCPPFQEITAGTTMTTATVYKYTFDGAPLPGTIRNNASITILNHSNYIGRPFGPNPKATYIGLNPPSPCQVDLGCTYTQGYWGNKPDVVWPAPYSRDDFFFQSGQTWQQVMDTPVNVSQGYYQLAHQYIAAVLNQANGAFVPQGVQDTLAFAKPWLMANDPSVCTSGGSCGLQKAWAGILDTYNNGLYEGGPSHCE